MSGELEPTMSLSPAVTLDAYGVHTVVEQLKSLGDVAARILVARIRKQWRFRGSGQTYVTLRLTANELDLIRQAGGHTSPQLVRYQYVAIYRHINSGTEVRLRSIDRPPKKRSFRTTDHGRKRFVRVQLFRINPTKESTLATKTKKKNKKAVDEDELEGLEELEELEEEEPDDDEEDDDDEDEAPPKRKRKKSSKKSTTKKSKKSKASEDDEEDEDEEDEDEEDETPKKKSKKGAKKGGGKKSSSKGSKKGGSDGPGRTTKELTGGVGTQELAAAASELAETEITGRDVRVYLRKNEIPKDEEHGRYTWPSEANKTFKKLAKDIAAEYEDED